MTQRLLELSGELRSHLVDPLALADQAEAFDAAIDAAPRNPRGQVYQALQTARAAATERLELATLVVRYEELKAELGYVEFADQMAAAARLATEVPAVPAALRVGVRRGAARRVPGHLRGAGDAAARAVLRRRTPRPAGAIR